MGQLEVSACVRTQDWEGPGSRTGINGWEEDSEASALPSEGDVSDIFAYDGPF